MPHDNEYMTEYEKGLKEAVNQAECEFKSQYQLDYSDASDKMRAAFESSVDYSPRRVAQLKEMEDFRQFVYDTTDRIVKDMSVQEVLACYKVWNDYRNV